MWTVSTACAVPRATASGAKPAGNVTALAMKEAVTRANRRRVSESSLRGNAISIHGEPCGVRVGACRAACCGAPSSKCTTLAAKERAECWTLPATRWSASAARGRVAASGTSRTASTPPCASRPATPTPTAGPAGSADCPAWRAGRTCARCRPTAGRLRTTRVRSKGGADAVPAASPARSARPAPIPRAGAHPTAARGMRTRRVGATSRRSAAGSSSPTGARASASQSTRSASRQKVAGRRRNPGTAAERNVPRAGSISP